MVVPSHTGEHDHGRGESSSPDRRDCAATPGASSHAEPHCARALCASVGPGRTLSPRRRNQRHAADTWPAFSERPSGGLSLDPGAATLDARERIDEFLREHFRR